MVEIVLSVAAKVSEYLVDPAVRQLGYLFNYRANIEDLSQQVEKLRDARARLQHSVDEAIGNGYIIEDDVRKWMNVLMLSREARKKAGVAVEIHGAGQFERVSYRAPLQEIRTAPSEALESRMLTLNEVMEALRDANINRIGVWGMGGVGKSTLVKQVAEQAEQEKLFRKVVMVPVIQTPDFKGIQQQIADKLGMKFEEVSEQGRADRLHQRIKQENTILIILDDLWAELELEKVGIPSPDDHKGCKLVLTSRNKQNTAGDSIENPELQPIAVDVAKECAGLPIAIVTVAKALKNKNVSIWKDALQQLKSQTSTNITGMETKVYSSLKLSYEHLEGDEVKYFIQGPHVFTLQQTTGRVEKWPRIDELQKVIWVNQDECDIHELPEGLCLANLQTLLLYGCKLGDIVAQRNSTVDSSQAVRFERFFHDKSNSVRCHIKLVPLEDLCMENSFTQWEGKGKSNACLAELKHLSHLTSLDIQIPDAKLLPKDVVFENLHLNVESSPEIQYIVNSLDLTSPHGAFPVMETLSLNQLINLQEVCRGQFPAGSFGCLREVEVEDCDGLKFLFSLSMARGLSQLEEIKATRCKKDLPKLSNLCFEENPVFSRPANTIVGPSTPPLNQREIRDGQLLLSLGGNLRSLELKNCMSLLKLFPPSLLQNLEELRVENCGQLEHVFDLEELNVDDGHVELLPKLEELTLIGLPKLRHICNCGSSRNHFPSSMASAPVGNIIFPKLSDIILESLPNLTSFVSPGYHSLQRLHHADLDTPFPVLFDERVAFPSLKFLIISGLDNVKKIWPNQIPQDSFSKLEVVKVASCGELLNIFPSCVLKRSQSLQLMEVVDCSLLEEVFDVEGVGFPSFVGLLNLLNMVLLFLANTLVST
ncbi:Disease resistance protein [Vitis vinifera]|uniref:Disease resistance protein n=1 Tax=Vitis vinifera TaxID=29760 RepID=A0A438HUL6_VITVI|nr:Disease resistance protein [Vitis vinifera]